MKFWFTCVSTLYLVAACFADCGDWLPYKNEKCFKILDTTLRTFDDAVKSCQALHQDGSRHDNIPSLPVISSPEEQSLLANYLFQTNKNIENFWIGSRFDNTEKRFKWLDNSEWNYTNWDTRGPRNQTDSCVEMESDNSEIGKWFDVPCGKKNLVVCQRVQLWSLARIQELLLEEQKKIEDLQQSLLAEKQDKSKKIEDLQQSLLAEKQDKTKKIEDLQQSLLAEKQDKTKKIEDLQQSLLAEKQDKTKKIEEMNKKLNELSLNQVPVGFIYVELPKEKPPTEIWPWMKWTDVSSNYAGVFFRVAGGNAASFGQIQNENVPRVLKAEKTEAGTTVHDEANPIEMIPGSWSKHIWVGGDTGNFIFWRFFTSGGEVRPVNMAIRIWKRVA